ncbi:methyltransferase domain-containing protein [Hyphomonas sp.]|uniref:methyltransferase domain-containing protein n=1 Tax=Hyphomonas sp. TaxID=87 RepID=UPI001D36A841|nr:methyltransferase domain-containing protein [Hyphomonas sp.]MBU3922289.1 methyltransferase domain-containing protein [Alphaproteobacteria bacterium]MBU4061918.1 methyltransferase domain-containing protein [Alphaproteobacteria bacterium]MBU4166073.1 methyltransferase domain-containing protein [Alphaproteobacteria bacterium]
MAKHLIKGSVAALSFVLVSACCTPPAAAPEAALAPPAEAAPAPEPVAVAATPDYSVFVDTPDRPDADIVADVNRKPAAVLGLFSPQPGDTILEIEAGGGYYTEILSRAVGPTGTIYMQNPAGFDAFLGDTVTKRLEGRLTNVTYLKSNFDAFAVADGEADIVTWFQGPHELWYIPEDQPEGFGEPAAVFAEIARALKSGGQFVVIDHAAPAGSPETTGGDTHRIDPAIIRTYAAAAGLVFETGSDLLLNPADDGTKNVFDPEIRGHTSQAILIFRKP